MNDQFLDVYTWLFICNGVIDFVIITYQLFKEHMFPAA